jgi:peptidase M1-like protein
MISSTSAGRRELTPRAHRRLGRVAAVLALALLAPGLSSCTVRQTQTSHPDPASYQSTLWAQRPVAGLAFDVADDRRSVTGHESVLFTPDAPTCELVFRAHPNNPTLAASGSSLTLTSAAIDNQPQLAHAIDALTGHFGPFPYADLWVSITPGQSDGTEFPGALQFGDTKADDLQALVAHEVSHQWFYSLVGNNQAEHPWLDESLATLGEALGGGDADYYRNYRVPQEVIGHMGEGMTYWAAHGGFRRYTQGVYNQGASVLLQARDQIGTDKFDAALRGYVRANAHRVATPADFARAFADHPEVLDALRRAGALEPQ